MLLNRLAAARFFVRGFRPETSLALIYMLVHSCTFCALRLTVTPSLRC